MFKDLRVADAEFSETRIYAVCIVGTVAAGFAIALELSGSNLRVFVIKSGSFEYEQETQDLYRGEVVGEPTYVPLYSCRLRYLGGTTNLWAGYSTTLDAQTFVESEWISYSAWPLIRPDFHNIGTTRMAHNPMHGVVDANCQVHEVDNLYMAGSSVFSSSGAGSPTLTIVALAIRLADHLTGRMQS